MDVDLREEGTKAFLHDEIDGVIDPGIGEGRNHPINAIVDAATFQMQKISDEPPLAWPATLWDDSKAADMKRRKGWGSERASDPAKIDLAGQVFFNKWGCVQG